MTPTPDAIARAMQRAADLHEALHDLYLETLTATPQTKPQNVTLATGEVLSAMRLRSPDTLGPVSVFVDTPEGDPTEWRGRRIRIVTDSGDER